MKQPEEGTYLSVSHGYAIDWGGESERLKALPKMPSIEEDVRDMFRRDCPNVGREGCRVVVGSLSVESAATEIIAVCMVPLDQDDNPTELCLINEDTEE